VDWSDLGVSGLLPTGMATLLLADVEGSTRLWETQPDERAAVARLNQTVSEVIAAHGGVRPVEQGEGDSFVAAFARASDAVACALELQQAPLAPIRLRIGVHTGEVQLRDEGNYAGATINRTARLRDLAHGGQTVLSGATEDMVVDRLPAGAWLTDLGTHRLRDLPRPERILQLCHPDLRNEFPPLRTADSVVAPNLPVQFTSFVGRHAEMSRLRKALVGNRLVTLTGAGGVGKTRLAVEVAAQVVGEFGDGVCYVDLAPITHPGVVPVTVARALGLPDQPGRSTMDTLLRFVRDRQMLVVLDNCEHLLDASAELVAAVLGAAPGLTLLATSRERIGVTGEATWRVPSLSLTDEAVELFTDRARLAQADFTITDDNAATVAEICQRLDGIPLAIELAAARVRALSLTEILEGLHDRFRLLTGGARTAVRRQQTLRASVDWSHALLSEPERVLFRRLAAFLGGFDLDAAQAVCGGGDVARYEVLDQLGLLVDKSLVVAESTSGRTRTGYSKRCASTHWKSWASPARPTRSAPATAITTRPWRRYSTPRRRQDMSGVSSRPKSTSTTCAPRSRGAAKTPRTSARWRWRRRCSRCGKRGDASGKGWPGSTPPWPTSTRSTPGWRPRCGRGRSPTGPCSPSGWAPPTAWTRLSRPWRSRVRSMTRPYWPGR
jgi:predicted ATPase/class 3 adenylate cyclase